ncbi:MAG: hypothetical protein SVG88_11135 [Halobacteriales archaeon]|nr:hypothetical protein [Halobacteriales archaeon]
MSTNRLQTDGSVPPPTHQPDDRFDAAEWEWGVATNASPETDDHHETPDRVNREAHTATTPAAHASNSRGLIQVAIGLGLLLLGIRIGIEPPGILLAVGDGLLSYATVTNIGVGCFAVGMLLILLSSHNI